jgi:hypothetical protein
MASKRTSSVSPAKTKPAKIIINKFDGEPTRDVTMCPACGGHVHNGQCIVCTAAWTQAQLWRGGTF